MNTWRGSKQEMNIPGVLVAVEVSAASYGCRQTFADEKLRNQIDFSNYTVMIGFSF